MILLMLTLILASIVGGLVWLYLTCIEPYVGKEKRQKYFAAYLQEVGKLHNEKLQDLKKELFKGLQNSGSPRKDKKLRILEIGAGSGTNLEFYPSNCTVVAVDPNPYSKVNFLEKLKKYPGIRLEKFVEGIADDMSELEPESFDAAISTLVMCNVNSVKKANQEIFRLLAPGGKFFYVEHILDKSGTLLNYIQRILDFFKIWNFFYDGCSISRQSDVEVTKTGFSKVEQKLFYIDTSGSWVWRMIRHHVSGVATK